MACNHRELYCMGHCAQCGDEVENIVWNQDEEITSLKQQVEALEAARFAYASEFDGDKESIHENIRKMKQQVEALKADCRFLLGFAPKDVPTKLDPTFYHTLTYEGDVQLQERVDRIRQATAQQGGEE